jgi:N4-gp56 family major capsid protein
VNAASEKALERAMRCSRLYGDIERLAERTSPPRKLGHKSNR